MEHNLMQFQRNQGQGYAVALNSSQLTWAGGVWKLHDESLTLIPGKQYAVAAVEGQSLKVVAL